MPKSLKEMAEAYDAERMRRVKQLRKMAAERRRQYALHEFDIRSKKEKSEAVDKALKALLATAEKRSRK
jgi:hypothetical protein